ncbi:LOW QUALITY PROTEIN: FRAS1-related extracellular matrix protein 3 [Eudromia elegans]
MAGALLALLAAQGAAEPSATAILVASGGHASHWGAQPRSTQQRSCPGALIPACFPCAFARRQVTYTHFGTRSPDCNRVQLHCDSPRCTLLKVEVDVLFQQLCLLSLSLPLPVEKLQGLSAPLDSSVLAFPSVSPATAAAPATAGPLPAYRHLLDTEGHPLPTGYSGDCLAMLQAGIRYHTVATTSLSCDRIPACMAVLPTAGPKEQEYFQVLVRIHEGTDNMLPKVRLLALLMMEAEQFVLTTLTPDMLAAEDLETPPDLLLFNLTSPWPSNPWQRGYLLSTNDLSRSLAAFLQQEVRELKIAYQPPTLDADQERLFQMEMEVLDCDGASSEPFAFVILVKPMNMLAPVAIFSYVTGPQLMLFGGRSWPLSGNLEISNENNLKEVKVWVTWGLHEELEMLGVPASRKYFTAVELEVGQVIYQHDGSKSYSDKMVFHMADGQHQVEFLYHITVAPDDDQAPLLNANIELVLSKHQTVLISPFVLSATDIDSGDPSIFVLFGDSVSLIDSHHFGELLLQAEPPASESKEGSELDRGSSAFRWHVVESEGMYERAVSEWQQHILDGRLFFRHTAPSSSPTMDHVMFHLQDNNPPNQSGEHVLTIKVQPVDSLPPALYPGTSLQMTVWEYQLTAFKRRCLRYTDLDTDGRDLKYTLCSPSTDTDESHSVVTGGIMLADSPGTAVTHFTQAQVNHHKVTYRPPDQELGITPRVVQFTFLVEDSAGNSLPGTFPLFLQPVDNQPPQITNTGFTVLENSFLLSSNRLDAADEDTDADWFVFTVTASGHGCLRYLEGGHMVEGEFFLLGDIASGCISYKHSGDEFTSDSYRLGVSDVPITVPITVKTVVQPVDDESPSLTLSCGHREAGAALDVLENGVTEITTLLIQGTDEDTDDLVLTFIVQDSPKLADILVGESGLKKKYDSFNLTITHYTPKDDILCVMTVHSRYLENISPVPGYEKSRVGTAINAFSIRDISLGHINYVQSVHRGVEPLEDKFTFQCSDSISFSLHNFFPITIIPTDDDKLKLFVCEFTVLEGLNLVIDTSILNGADADLPPGKLHFVIAVPPKHRQFVQQLSMGTVPACSFTLEEIQEALNIVEHSDSETTEDNFQIQLNDGQHTVEQKVSITVIPVDDETPRMAINNGLQVDIGKSKVISSQDLKAADIDSEDKNLAYIMRLALGPGLLQHLNSQGKVLCNITQCMNFTLDDLDQGIIHCVHTGLCRVRDLIKFDVTDGTNPLVDRYFYITISSIDIVFPEVINKGVTLKEGGKVKLTTDLLSTSDVNSPDESLCLSVTRSPTQGHLENSDSPVPVVSFTQLQLAGSKIYIHTAEDEINDSFEFEVTDEYNPVFHNFRVSITNVDNKKPIFTIGDLVVEEGKTRLITPFELTAQDRDTPDYLLLFTVTQVPVHGQILYNSSCPVTTLTKHDLNKNLISYRRDGTEKQDSLSFSATDVTSTNFYVYPDTAMETHQPQMLRIRINLLDNGVPHNKGALTLRRLPTGQLGFLITSKALKAEDRDTSHKLLEYKVTDGPEHGFVTHTGLGNESIRTFMQADIDMKISCILKKSCVTSPMREVDTNTIFTNTKSISPDSIYLQADSRLQRAVSCECRGSAGLELLSPVYTVSREEGFCQPRVPGTVGAEPFSAKICYTGPDDLDYPSLIRLTVTMSHVDGMLPVISTCPISSFELTLSPGSTRVRHKYSNQLDYDELQTKHGLITQGTQNPKVTGETSPSQYSALRSARTLRFYRSLGQGAALWELSSCCDMAEPLSLCGGTAGTNGHVGGPFLPGAGLGEDTGSGFPSGCMWIALSHEDADQRGRAANGELPNGDSILGPAGGVAPRLVLIMANYNLPFVLSKSSLSPMVMSADHLGLMFTLSLLQSELTSHQPVQQWHFISDFAVRDYSGSYMVKLVPCTAAPNQHYALPVIYSPREPVAFDVDISFQQISDPVAAEFSLNTKMFLLSKKAWISDGSMGFGDGADVAFTEGSKIYGRVMVDPVQNLGASFSCSIEQVFLCTGADGYVPKYSPDKQEYDCLADSPSLLYRFKILDKAQPETQARVFGDLEFHATLADASLVKQPGSDGFSLSSTPLFQVAAGWKWHLHTIYTV